jgi:hypothetical protein
MIKAKQIVWEQRYDGSFECRMGRVYLCVQQEIGSDGRWEAYMNLDGMTLIDLTFTNPDSAKAFFQQPIDLLIQSIAEVSND